ncbi:hypothetical protein OHD62_05975 [Mesorhizobium sp. YC-39]|nr:MULTISPECIES: hypothetical protein [unclassified Mesorhizobium]MCV3205685.1 hypothetical protein [Mesorhizobium sp. YC-2]MCV3227916.1 hypothetical protein [Mesorhizobium sp. YC-39]
MLAEFTKTLTTHDVENEIVRAPTHDIRPRALLQPIAIIDLIWTKADID